jgi:mRNA-degrading endonuclease toxin of MazEF toxin-antitoxin module
VSSPSYGRIVIATVADQQGRNQKARPLVIITPNKEIAAGEPLVAVAISTTYQQLDKSLYVTLPWHPAGNSRTKLKRDSAAVCTWLVEITESAIEGYGGLVPDETMKRIQETLATLDP